MDKKEIKKFLIKAIILRLKWDFFILGMPEDMRDPKCLYFTPSRHLYNISDKVYMSTVLEKCYEKAIIKYHKEGWGGWNDGIPDSCPYTLNDLLKYEVDVK